MVSESDKLLKIAEDLRMAAPKKKPGPKRKPGRPKKKRKIPSNSDRSEAAWAETDRTRSRAYLNKIRKKYPAKKK